MDVRSRGGKNEKYELLLVFTTKGQGEKLTRRLKSAVELHAYVFRLCVLVHLLCAHLCVCACVVKKQQLWHLRCSTPVRYWRGSAQTCRLPRGPAGSPITPTQAPAVKHILLTHSFFPRFLSCCYAFILHHRTPMAPSLLSQFSLILLSSHSIFSVFLTVFPLVVSRASCQPDVSLQLLPSIALTSFDRRIAGSQVKRQI